VLPGTAEWLAQVDEDVVDPDQRIIDPHHHLWPPGGALPYGLDELHADTGSGHRVEATVFVECRAAYRPGGPEHLRPVGETEFVAQQAEASAARPGRAEIRGIVAHADLRAGDVLDEVLDAHAAAGGHRFKGIRHAGAHDPDPGALRIPGRAPEGLYADPGFRAGVARLGERGLTYDTWHYHHQNPAFADLVAAVPGTTLVLDHFGTPLGVGRFAGRRDEVFEQWRADITAIARHPNVVAKLGGLAMPDNGFGWHERDRPATSDELVEAQARYYHHTIDCFGPDRCMFESNFPVDRFSISYRVLWNAFHKLAARYTPAERDQMFWGTAARVYRLA
jgi:predicted TIM-barrel fold metal-dependent hydrolase